jgi:FHA domain
MARLKCAACGAIVGRADVVCRKCGQPLLDEGATETVTIAPETPSESALRKPPQPLQGEFSSEFKGSLAVPAIPMATSADQCTHCGADIPDPRNLVCLQCFGELKAAPADDNHVVAQQTFREAGGRQLILRFDFGTIELGVGQEMLLGRDATDQRLAALRHLDNVSRSHATIGLTPRGAWVRDESSTNGTFVNGQPAPSGAVVALTQGAELRLASNVRATVQLREIGRHD